MLALGIEFLTGRYVASAYNDRRAGEWPPHPARVFSAMVATHFDDPDADPRERTALEWLEQPPPPELHCTAAAPRDVVDVFVPVNDTSVVADLTGDAADVDDARAALVAAADVKEQAKARKHLEKLEAKLKIKIAKAIAPTEGKMSAELLAFGASILPERRGRQPRTFPSVTPDEPRVTLVWSHAAVSDEHRAVIDALAARVVRVGHSSSLVSMRVLANEDVTSQPFRVPDPDGAYMLRGVEAGQFARLCDDFVGHQGVASGRILPAAVHPYAAPRPAVAEVPQSVFGDDWIVFGRHDGARLPGIRAVDLARAVRKALQSLSPQQPPPELLSGHQPAGAPSDRPHLAIVPLPFVGDRHADGDLRGVALIFPRDTSIADRRAVLQAIHAWEQSARADRSVDPPRVPVFAPGGVELRVARDMAPSLKALRPLRWCGPSRSWVTVTPIALDRHPGDLHSRDSATLAAAVAVATQTIVDSCIRIGLPTPQVAIVPAAPVVGASKARAFPAYPPIAGRTRRALTHAVLEFDRPVRGPILLGAGRYHGLGLLCPSEGGDS